MSAPPLDVRFVVKGEPIPKGNHAAFPIGRGRCVDCAAGKRCQRRNCFGGILVGTTITDDGGGALEAWQGLIRVEAISARNRAGQRIVEAPGPVRVDLIFLLARPEAHWGRAGQLTAAGRDRPYPSVKPDRDKLERAVFDGLINALVEDDAQIVAGEPVKVYTGPRGPIGVVVRARRISTHDAWIEHELAHHGIPIPWATGQGALL